jgi:hypothetical protein
MAYNECVLYSLCGEMFNRQEDNRQFLNLGSGSINEIFSRISVSQNNIIVVFWNPSIYEFKVVPTILIEFVAYQNKKDNNNSL